MQHTIELSARMAMNASLVPDGAKVAGGGWGHGFFFCGNLFLFILLQKKHVKKLLPWISMRDHFLMQEKILKRQVLVIALTAV